MKGKSLVVSIMSVMIAAIASYSGLVAPHIQAWLGIVSFGLTILLSSQIFASGTFPKGWTTVMWITNISGIVIQLMSAIGEKGLIDPNICNYIIIGINILLTGFVKDYGSGNSIVK